MGSCFLCPRCVVMVGMPYPNIKSPELQEKMAYLDQTLVSTSSVQRVGGDGWGEDATSGCDTRAALL